MISSLNNSTTKPHSDSEMVRLAKQGNADAFAAIFNANRTRIYSLCLRMTSNTAEAEDLTQEAFLHAFRKLATFRGDSALSTWLHRVAVNTVLMHFRKQSRRQVSLEESLTREDEGPKREHGSVDGGLASSVDRIALTRAMKELPVGYRAIFVMHEVNGYDHREIAALRSCSIGNSKSQLHKAKVRMRELLSNGLESRTKTAPKERRAVCRPLVDANPPLSDGQSNLTYQAGFEAT